MELHFFPGQHLLVVYKSGKPLVKFEAWGGPSTVGNDPRMPEEPTWPGRYVIHRSTTYSTPTWPMSKIKWGTPLSDKPDKNDVFYKLPSGKWGSVTKDIGVSRTEVIDLYGKLYGRRMIPKTWVFNDFGPTAIRWFKDNNGNNTLDGSERLSGQMFHTTPVDEAASARGLPVSLASSHGCIHLRPKDRNSLLVLGVFKPKTPFVVHQYHERH